MKRLYSFVSAVAAVIGSVLSGCGRGQANGKGHPPPPEPEIRWVGHDSGYRGRTVHRSDGTVDNTQADNTADQRQ